MKPDLSSQDFLPILSLSHYSLKLCPSLEIRNGTVLRLTLSNSIVNSRSPKPLSLTPPLQLLLGDMPAHLPASGPGTRRPSLLLPHP